VEAGRPTPILIRGAERWCAIDTDPELASPFGIYGRRFHKAKPEAIVQAVTRLSGGALTNLIAMEAPMASGRYTRKQVEFILETAWAGFSGACAESGNRRVVVHTGHWGTGAYGGNRVLMALLQLLAARLAGISGLVYHSLDSDGVDAFSEARRHISSRLAGAHRVQDAIDEVLAMGFSWGTSDGN
jgi:hypothetical protein